jgi:uncharacterized protein YbjT (DUF2867 family)
VKIVVIGGSGLIGSRLVSVLEAAGHEVVAASPRTGIDAVTGQGLAAALAGAAVVVDVANAPSFEEAAVLEFFTASTRNLLAAEAAAGVGHHVALSVVGTDRLQESPYFRGKIAQERLIQAGSILSTIVRATQFFEFVAGIADAATAGDTVRVPSVLIQPIAADDIAAILGRVAVAAPADGTIEVAGPEPFRLDTIIRRSLAVQDDPRTVLADPAARYFGAHLEERTLVPDEPTIIGETRFEDWLG